MELVKPELRNEHFWIKNRAAAEFLGVTPKRLKQLKLDGELGRIHGGNGAATHIGIVLYKARLEHRGLLLSHELEGYVCRKCGYLCAVAQPCSDRDCEFCHGTQVVGLESCCGRSHEDHEQGSLPRHR